MSRAVPAGGVTGLILAGGQARRMGGEDKGLIELCGQPMIAHALAALAPQVDSLLINANRHLDRYQVCGDRYGAGVVSDTLEGYQGPLAGIARGLAACTTEYLVCVPCDSPLVSAELVARLEAARQVADAEISVAFCGRLQPVFALLPTSLLPSLEIYLAAGDRKIDRWYHQHRVAEADFSDRPEQFLNVNTPEEHAELERKLVEMERCP
ncbi:MAG: molybdenum cofactor guanylyltransferase [Gammaproteobacteria bacterium]|nr:MAG: molybdenum cofactor guanylyltransferase [Gammaproteobacteria bacterium]